MIIFHLLKLRAACSASLAKNLGMLEVRVKSFDMVQKFEIGHY